MPHLRTAHHHTQPKPRRMCSAEPSLVEFIAPNEPRAFRRRHMAWDEGGAAPERGVAVACLLIAHPVSPRSRSVDYANRRICQEDITCTFVTRRRGRFGPYSWPTPPAPQQTKKPVPPPQLSKKQIEQQRRAKQAEQDRARAKAAAAAASPKTPVRPPVVLPPLPAAPKKTKSCLPPKFDKDALRRKQLEEDRALQEAIEAAEQVRKLARQCIVCRNNEGTMRCGVCQALICRDCAELGAIQKDSVFEAHLYQVPSLSDTIHLQNCARCHFPEDGVAFPIAMIEKVGCDQVDGKTFALPPARIDGRRIEIAGTVVSHGMHDQGILLCR